jgi:hypothetical protein
VRISVIGVLATVIALRRRMDPGLYGSELAAAAGAGQVQGTAQPPLQSSTLSAASVQQAKDRQTRLLQVRVRRNIKVLYVQSSRLVLFGVSDFVERCD